MIKRYELRTHIVYRKMKEEERRGERRMVYDFDEHCIRWAWHESFKPIRVIDIFRLNGKMQKSFDCHRGDVLVGTYWKTKREKSHGENAFAFSVHNSHLFPSWLKTTCTHIVHIVRSGLWQCKSSPYAANIRTYKQIKLA